MGFEPTTSTLARLRSTPELRPRRVGICLRDWRQIYPFARQIKSRVAGAAPAAVPFGQLPPAGLAAGPAVPMIVRSLWLHGPCTCP